MEMRTEYRGKLVGIALRQNQCDVPCSLVFAYELILGQEKAPFVMAPLQQDTIRISVAGKQRVIAGSAQVAAKLPQHFVAKKTGR